MDSMVGSGGKTRRHIRVRGPFDGVCLGRTNTPVLIYYLNAGGGYVNFVEQPPASDRFTLRIDLPRDGALTVNAEVVYRDEAGVGVRFVDLDEEGVSQLKRTVEALVERPL